MFRPTHFVILFAVVLCAAALPAGPGNPTPIGSGRSTDIGPAADQLAQGAKDAVESVKSDLNTDATTYDWGYRYAYDVPKYGRGLKYGGLRHGWGFGKTYVPDPHILYPVIPVIV